MIRELAGSFEVQAALALRESAPILRCDVCNSDFQFATVVIDPMAGSGNPRAFHLIHPGNVWRACKFCPVCGARNTQPRPVAEKRES